jgi:hypothetical protein
MTAETIQKNKAMSKQWFQAIDFITGTKSLHGLITQ